MTLVLTVPGGTPAQHATLPAEGQQPVRARVEDLTSLPGAVRMSNVRWVDGGTSVPLAEQTGAIGAPFATVQAAVDSLGVSPGTVLIAPGVYAETVAIPVAIHLIGLCAGRVAPTVNITAITTSGSNTSLTRLTVGSLTTSVSGCSLIDVTVTGAVTLNAAFSAQNASVGALTCTNATGTLVAFNGLITLTQTNGSSRFNSDCTFQTAADISGPGGTATVFFDASSAWQFFIAAGNTITAVPTVRVRARVATATVSIAVPALLAGVTGEAVVALAGTELAAFTTAEGVCVNPPVAALAPGVGAGGAFLSGRITSTGNLTCTFIGPLTGGATPGFIVSGLT